MSVICPVWENADINPYVDMSFTRSQNMSLTCGDPWLPWRRRMRTAASYTGSHKTMMSYRLKKKLCEPFQEILKIETVNMLLAQLLVTSDLNVTGSEKHCPSVHIIIIMYILIIWVLNFSKRINLDSVRTLLVTTSMCFFFCFFCDWVHVIVFL